MTQGIAERLREPILADAVEQGRIADGALCERLIRERSEAADRIEALERALKPFARVNDHIPSTWEDIDGVSRATELTSRVYVTVIGENAGNVTVGDFRLARSAIGFDTGDKP
jgi:hypothetical protein